jgi:predicted NBD/HSP70 family sugar kinase
MKNTDIKINPAFLPSLDTDFVPAVLWNKAYQGLVKKAKQAKKIKISLERPNGNISVFTTTILPDDAKKLELTKKYVERIIKFLIWMKGGNKITIAGSKILAEELQKIYSASGERAFDNKIIGEKIYGGPLTILSADLDDIPEEKEAGLSMGGNLDGCRIGFDLGGSDRKCAALIDGNVVFSEEIKWDPYFQKDCSYHRKGIEDSLSRARAKLPRIDAIGGSAAGVYVDNKVKVASLFRGISEEDFKKHVENIFLDIQKDWGNIPFIVVNDGEVTALAGAMEIKDSAVLGISMGTSMAAGYVTPRGNITDWLNELAFAPVDYRDNAPQDEWSGDRGCGVQYFSQQAVARLADKAGIIFDKAVPFAERLSEVQTLAEKGDERAAKIYESIGIYFGYSIAHYADFYDFRNLLILGRVTSGDGGEMILSQARKVLDAEFPEISKKVKFRIPDERNKRHGQAIAAASLPKIEKRNI